MDCPLPPTHAPLPNSYPRLSYDSCTYRFVHLEQRLSIGAKRNLAVELAKGDTIVTWDDDDYYRSFRITRQVQPIHAGVADLTTMAHGMYLYVNDMEFFNWTMDSVRVGGCGWLE